MKTQLLNNQLLLTITEFQKFNHVRFNPSIVHIQDNEYLLCYRLFIPYENLKKSKIPIPWKSKWQNNVDTTVLCKIQLIKNGKFKVLSEDLLQTEPEMYNNRILDTRIFKDINNNVSLSFNTWTTNPKGQIRAELKKQCVGNWSCTYIAKSKLTIKHNKIKLSSFKYPCLNLRSVLPLSNRCHIGQREEKNWVFWYTKNNNEMISYFVEPHIVFQTNKKDNRCKSIAQTSNGNLSKIKALYGNMNFLLGTPPILYNKNEYIAVGHMKYNYKKSQILKESNLKNKVLHFNKACDPKKPGNLIYMMYFYTFSTTFPYEIKRIGHSFIPKGHGKYLLTFPMGIANHTNKSKYVLSYGEADQYIKLLTISKKEIENMLLDYNTLRPEEYEFRVL